MLADMRRIPIVGLVALLGTGACYSHVNEPPASPPWTPAFVSGPPGGAMDPGYAAQDPIDADPAAQGAGAQDQPVDPAGSAPVSGGVAVAGELGAAPGSGAPGAPGAPITEGEVPAPSTDPADPGYAIGSVTDEEIDTTLAPYGQWIESEEYGRVWRPDVTVVGVDFTPYETCGTWVYTDHGWTFTCDWDWGWLPFHYGQWAWIADAWCWVRDYTWSPAWVEWRSGGGYVGWRPLAPRVRDHRRYPSGGSSGGGPIVRDHRDGRPGNGGSSSGPIVRDHRDGRPGNGGSGGPLVRDHRKQRDSDWRFTHERDFGRSRIRASLYRNPAEGIRVTSTVTRPPVRGGTRVGAAEVMRGRIHARYSRDGASRPGASVTSGAGQPTRGTYQPPSRGYQPTRPERPSYGTYQPPSRGTYQPPSRGSYSPPSRDSYQPPSRGSYSPPSRDSYQPPSRGSYSPPSRDSYQPPSRGSYSPPSHGGVRHSGTDYRPPSRGTYSPPSRGSYSPPSRGSYSPPSRSSGSSYSPPSRSRSSYGSSHDSGSSGRGIGSSRASSSSSSSSSSSRESSSSSGSRSSGGGGRRR
jgi:hypothetical protein